MNATEMRPQGRWRLDRRERRRLGVTFSNVLAKARELCRENVFSVDDVVDGEGDIPEMALAVLDRIIKDDPRLFQGPGWDEDRMDKILAWIERILELLAKWLPILFAL